MLLVERVRTVGLLVVASLVLSGCGGGEESSSASTATSSTVKPETPSSTEATATPTADTAADTAGGSADKASTSESGGVGSFSGRVVLDGITPALVALISKGDSTAKDSEVCAAEEIPDESMLVGGDDGIANVFVFLRKAPKGLNVSASAEPIAIDQKGCRFFPHASVVQLGQPVQVLSDDAVQHNVHTFPKRNQGVNLLINANDREGVELKYRSAESEPFAIKCDIHSWMVAYQMVLDHPFAAVTDADGNFTIEGLPTGSHEFRVWHEMSGFLERKLVVDVTTGGASKELKYSVASFAGLEDRLGMAVATIAGN